VGELLIEFFRYFCWSFDLRHRVVSIRQPRALSKLDKAEQNGWLQSDNLGYDFTLFLSRVLLLPSCPVYLYYVLVSLVMYL
jgi:hypothetical protein